MAIARRIWRVSFTLDDVGTAINDIEIIYYLRPDEDVDNPGMQMDEQQKHLTIPFSDLSQTHQDLVTGMLTGVVRTNLDTTRPINPGPEV